MERDKMKLISKVAERAVIYLDGWDKFNIVMDLDNCIEGGCDLDLEGLLKCDPVNLVHDIVGINRNLDHRTYKLNNHFYPRMAI